MFTDQELIDKVKQEADSSAISELVNRHTGVYLNVVNKFCSYSSGKISFQDLSDDKAFNIYKFAQTYNPDKNCKFSTYVSNMTRYTCLDLLKQEPEAREYLDAPALTPESFSLSEKLPDTETTNGNLDSQDFLQAIDSVSTNKKFKQIVQWRHVPAHTRPMTWGVIGKKLGMSHEGVRKIYNREIKKIKSYLNK